MCRNLTENAVRLSKHKHAVEQLHCLPSEMHKLLTGNLPVMSQIDTLNFHWQYVTSA